MGEIKEILASISFHDSPDKVMQVELNGGVDGGEDVVHLQTEHLRLEFYKPTFMRFATTIMLAAHSLKKHKRLDHAG